MSLGSTFVAVAVTLAAVGALSVRQAQRERRHSSGECVDGPGAAAVCGGGGGGGGGTHSRSGGGGAESRAERVAARRDRHWARRLTKRAEEKKHKYERQRIRSQKEACACARVRVRVYVLGQTSRACDVGGVCVCVGGGGLCVRGLQTLAYLATLPPEEAKQLSGPIEARKAARADRAARAADVMVSGRPRMVLDLSLAGTNSEAEARSLAKQCQYIVWSLRTAAHPVAVHLTSYEGPVVGVLEVAGAATWAVNKVSAPWWEVGPRRRGAGARAAR